mmetsp:Transcript_39963/g.63973  ORF Transcript_39963/g.63973 Transcript_39963/m.63973 type:complete len:226 (-) Transcript_39963:731-1408(-)
MQVLESIGMDTMMRRASNDTILDHHVVGVRHIRTKVGRALARDKRLGSYFNHTEPALLMMEHRAHFQSMPVEIDGHIISFDCKACKKSHGIRSNKRAARAHILSFLLLARIPHAFSIGIGIISRVHIELDVLHNFIDARLQDTVRAVLEVVIVDLDHGGLVLHHQRIWIRHHPLTRLHHGGHLGLVAHTELAFSANGRLRVVRGTDAVIVRRVDRMVCVGMHMCT